MSTYRAVREWQAAQAEYVAPIGTHETAIDYLARTSRAAIRMYAVERAFTSPTP